MRILPRFGAAVRQPADLDCRRSTVDPSSVSVPDVLVRSSVVDQPLPPFFSRFGIRSANQVGRDLGEVVRGALTQHRFQFGPSSAGLLRPDLSLPAYAGFVPDDGIAPIFNLFDRTGGGRHYSQRVTRKTARDFRGGRLSYDEHDGTDFVCPIGTPLTAAAPGTVVMIRDRWLRGGLTIAVDHGDGTTTQYTHCAKALLPIGERVERGQPIALSGAAGYDLVQFFPFIPPHIHFMVWIAGRPIDPFLADGESDRAGAWLGGMPMASGPLPQDDLQDPSPVDERALDELIEACTDPRVRQEIASERHRIATCAAILEDALHHERYAFPKEVCDRSVRPPLVATTRVSMPLPSSQYNGAFFADSPFTRP
jgi:murein DD-endopeptidase MepM/ murein hydrolase activator NlpD